MFDTFDGASAVIGQFGTSNPKVAAFLKATFALEAMGIAGLNHASESNAQNVGQQTGGQNKGR